MRKYIQILKSLCESRYTPYTLQTSRVNTITIPIQESILNIDYEQDQWGKGGDNVPTHIWVNTGQTRRVKVLTQIWVAYHKKTGLPKYKTITL